MPGVVSPELPIAFAGPTAYGDLLTSLLALVALVALRTRLGIVLVWVFSIVGTIDLMNAYYEGNHLGFALGLQGALYFIPTRGAHASGEPCRGVSFTAAPLATAS